MRLMMAWAHDWRCIPSRLANKIPVASICRGTFLRANIACHRRSQLPQLIAPSIGVAAAAKSLWCSAGSLAQPAWLSSVKSTPRHRGGRGTVRIDTQHFHAPNLATKPDELLGARHRGVLALTISRLPPGCLSWPDSDTLAQSSRVLKIRLPLGPMDREDARLSARDGRAQSWDGAQLSGR